MSSVIVLTGATSGIGRAAALALAGRADHLILHGLEPVDAVQDQLEAVRAAGARVTYAAADFGDRDDVGRLLETLRDATDHIDVLINNAARPGPASRTLTAAGDEVTFQTNYLAPVMLTTGLLDLIGRDGPGRVVNLASATHFSAELDLDDLTFARRGYSSSAVYAHSKLALVTYSCWLASHRPTPGLDVVSLHPGVIATPLLHAMFSVTGDPPEHAAANLLDVAFRHGDNGTYYDERETAPPNPQATDPAVQDRLHELTLRLLDPDRRAIA